VLFSKRVEAILNGLTGSLQTKRTTICLVLILVFGSVSRTFNLQSNLPSYFSDEVDIAYQVRSLITTGRDYEGYRWPLQIHSFSDNRTSIPIYLTLIMTVIFRLSELVAVRLVPAVFGILGILFTYLLINQVFAAKAPYIGFLSAGLYFFGRFQQGEGPVAAIVSWLFLSLTPLVYSTAKLSIIFLPLVFWLWPRSKRSILLSWKGMIFITTLFLPLAIILFQGGAAKRFRDISIFTDPAVVSKVNSARQILPNQNTTSGTLLSTLSIISHNKVRYWSETVISNIAKSLSPGFLFINGDSLPRHSAPGFGLLHKSYALLIVFGLLALVADNKKTKKIILTILVLIGLSVVPSALTRDGATHATRLFLLNLPLLLLASLGLSRLLSLNKKIAAVFLLLLVFETINYQYFYFTKYFISTEKYWHAGIKEAVEAAGKFPGKSIIISPTFEPPLIFYLYYANVQPGYFQKLFKESTFLTPIDQSLNLEGFRFDSKDIYFAKLKNKAENKPLKIPNAVYFQTDSDLPPLMRRAPTGAVVLPSGRTVYKYMITD